MTIYTILWATLVMLIVVIGISISTLTLAITYVEIKKIIKKNNEEK